MPNKDSTGTKGPGSKDSHGKGKDKSDSTGQNPMTGGEKKNKEKAKK